METIKVREKGSGLTTNEELDLFKYAEEGLKNFTTNHLKIVQHISGHMSTHHKGKWTVFVVESLTTPWDLAYQAVDNKFIEFSLKNCDFFVYKSNA